MYDSPVQDKPFCCLCKEELPDIIYVSPQQKALRLNSLITNQWVVELYYRNDICVKCEHRIVHELQHLCHTKM